MDLIPESKPNNKLYTRVHRVGSTIASGPPPPTGQSLLVRKSLEARVGAEGRLNLDPADIPALGLAIRSALIFEDWMEIQKLHIRAAGVRFEKSRDRPSTSGSFPLVWEIRGSDFA
ncbi:hypothetical protein KM043_003590 [Ampulex compressa]|nr:hypothetical protein KM043_003590 [Ampulex compressa]